jgi:hypothetical protein
MTRGRWKVRFVGACLLAALGGCGAVQDWRNEVDPIRGGTPIPTGSAAAGRPVAPGDAPPPPLLTGSPSTSPTALTVGASAPAVSIQMPRPCGQAPAVPGVIVPTSGTLPAPAVPAGGYTFEQVQQALKARGVTEQHLDTTGKPDEWNFTCAIPYPNDPLRRRNYETKRVGAGGLEAMIAVLHEIEQDH